MVDKKPISKQGIKVGKQGEKIFITLDEQKFYEIPPAVYTLLCICDGTRTLEEIAIMLCKDTDTNVEDAKKILSTVLNELTETGFIEWI
ncbi:MAG: DUF4423 domain-containing protein [Candidatus Parvarchaeota archaeon]|nr:DUF4423 domain-containing protein [Candidatus Jingweiarchaeum tengchongense]MCW1300474.1 DUF4423 domain-containing protein [Candidatus Jingweiarchaeum tengchongense]MCW1304711.1 DUF4423 domain-containing protein [Candidatus Jingweiarchaeum tengchongense]MCW1306216.1 DUF4423 domain-containing protein [Candidatus Jingweiarchaeum tengchongense]MCW1309552.1 DUF4423 domain-containing protein [Candidatus Jingweiarchaeum tengchongense]